MARWISLAVVSFGSLCLVACQQVPRPAHPDPDGAVLRFERGLAAVSEGGGEPEVVQAVLAEAVADLFAEAACRQGWASWSLTAPDARAAQMFAACRRAYCPKLPAPKPRACGSDAGATAAQVAVEWPELAWAALARDLGQDRAARVFVGLMTLQTVASAPIEIELPQASPGPSPSVAPAVRLYCDPQATRIEFGEQQWRLPERPTGKDLQPLVEALGDRRSEVEVILYADPKVPYARLVAVMDAIRGAGIDRLMVAVPKDEVR